MAKIKNLPKTLFVKVENDGDASYFSAVATAESLVEMEETVKIGRYELVELADATGVAQIIPPKAKRRNK